jgi:8-oxo-dGTP diphosphatase
MAAPKIPIPCVACIFKDKDGNFLVSKRVQDGLYQFAGGKVEYWETLEEAIIREVKEETSIELMTFKQLDTVTVLENGFHYIVTFFIAKLWYGEPENTEPDKCYGWEWFGLEDFKKANLLTSIKELRKLHPKLFLNKDELLKYKYKTLELGPYTETLYRMKEKAQIFEKVYFGEAKH